MYTTQLTHSTHEFKNTINVYDRQSSRQTPCVRDYNTCVCVCACIYAYHNNDNTTPYIYHDKKLYIYICIYIIFSLYHLISHTVHTVHSSQHHVRTPYIYTHIVYHTPCVYTHFQPGARLT